MKWLVITNIDKLQTSIKESLLAADKKNRIITSDLDAKNLSKLKKDFKDLAGIFVFNEDEDKLSDDKKSLLSSLLGFFAFECINKCEDGYFLDENKKCKRQSRNIFNSAVTERVLIIGGLA